MIVGKRKTKGEVVFDVINTFLLILLCVIVLLPIYHMFVVSISDAYAVARGEVSFMPIKPNFKAYKALFMNPNIPRSFLNSVVYTVMGTAVNMVMTVLCAYPLSRKRFYGRSVFTFLIIFTMFFDAGMISRYMVVRTLHLRNTIFAIILPGAIDVMNMVIMRTFFQAIPEDLYESAYLDGANDLQILARIVLPLSTASFATIGLFYAVGHWNSWFNALVYLDDQQKFPMQLWMRSVVMQGSTDGFNNYMTEAEGKMEVIGVSVRYAMVFIAMVPILCVYPFIQKYFVKGVMIGSLKG